MKREAILWGVIGFLLGMVLVNLFTRPHCQIKIDDPNGITKNSALNSEV